VTVKDAQRSLARMREAPARKTLSIRRSLGRPCFPAKDLDLVTEHHDLEVSVEPIACGGQTKDGADHQIEEREQHPRILGNRWSGGESAFRYPSGLIHEYGWAA
jgi:hypothetical protein